MLYRLLRLSRASFILNYLSSLGFNKAEKVYHMGIADEGIIGRLVWKWMLHTNHWYARHIIRQA